MLAVNITLDIYNIAIDFIILLAIYSSGINKSKTSDLDRGRKWYHVIAVINLVMSAIDIPFRFFEGDSQAINFTILPFATFSYYFVSILLLFATAKCVVVILNLDKPLKRGRKIFRGLLFLSFIAYIALLILTPFKRIMYVIDDDNFYLRGDYFYLALVIQLAMYAGLVWYLGLNKRTVHPLKIIVTVFFLFFPQIAQIIQMAMPGISLINTGYSLVFVIMFIFSNSSAEGALKKAQSQIKDKASEIEKNRLKILEMRNHIVESLSNLVENRDESSAGHIDRTKRYVELIALQLRKDGYYKDLLTQDYLKLLERAVPVYDIGKIVVSDSILKKTERLSPEEKEQLQRHAPEGGRIVQKILGGYESPEYIQMAVDIATYHHEKWDGTGYPEKLSGEDIPLCARIMALADSFDSMVSQKSSKGRMTYDEAFAAIEDGIGSDFDPAITREFLKIKHKAIEINESRRSAFRL